MTPIQKIEKHRDRFAVVHQGGLTQILDRAGERAEGSYQRISNPDMAVNAALLGLPSDLRKWGWRAYLNIADHFYQSQFENAFAESKAIRPSIFTNADFTAWFNKHIGKRITNITPTVRKEIIDLIQKGISGGLDSRTIAKQIRNTAAFSKTRATTIARTEMVAASNAGTYFAMRDMARSTKSQKVWMATSDGKTRDDHAAANGQTVAIAEPFTVGGEDLMFPGDTSLGASAAQIVNCRCAISFSR